MKNKLVVVLLLFALLISGTAVSVKAEENTSLTVLEDEYNIMLVIDKSGSMNNADPNHIAQDAAAMFVDSFQVKNSSIGLVTFSKDSAVITDPLSIADSKNKQKLKKAINDISYDALGTGGTDLGRAVGAAASTLEKNKDSGKKNLIIMFTDGYTEGVSGSALDESNKALEEGIATAKSLNCEVYVVGLNSDGGIQEEGVRQISYIAGQTQRNKGINKPSKYDTTSQGKVNYLITDSTNGIYSFYTAMFALLNGAVVNNVESQLEKIDNATYTTFPVEVSGTLVKEVDIYLTSDEKINLDTLLIRNPDGEKTDENGLSVSYGQRYAFIKLDSPVQGTWKVSIKGDVKSRLSFVMVTDIDMDVKYDDWKNGERNIYVSAMNDGEYINDADFYDGLEKKISFSDTKSDTKVENEDLKYDGSLNDGKGGLYYTVTSGKLPDGEYKVTVTLKNDNLDKTVEAKNLFVVDANEIAKGTAEETEEPTTEAEKFQRDENGNILVTDAVTVVSGKEVTYDVIKRLKNRSDEIIADSVMDINGSHEEVELTMVQEGIFSFKPSKTGDYTYDITVRCADGETCIVHLYVKAKVNIFPIIIMIIAILIIVSIIVILIIRKSAIVLGTVYVSLVTNYGYINLTWKSLKGTSFSLFKLLMDIVQHDTSESGIKNLSNDIMALKPLLNTYSMVIAEEKDENGFSRKTYKIKKKGQREMGLPYDIDVQMESGIPTAITRIRIDFGGFM